MASAAAAAAGDDDGPIKPARGDAALPDAMGPGNVGGGGDDDDDLSRPPKRSRTAVVVPSSSGMQRGVGKLHSCIVKLIVQSVSPNYREPWRRNAQDSWSGTGFLVDGRRVVTNAHVVQRSSHVRARKSSSPVMFSCTVEWISVPLDLALLSVNNEKAFFESGTNGGGRSEKAEGENANATATATAASSSSSPPPPPSASYLSLCPTLPRLDENVTCVGFPQGGQQISVTRGVVSRADVGSNGVLRIQIDAAINPGNSGGPVFNESGGVVGVAMSHLKGASNVGYIIPVSVLSHFLGMCRNGVEATPIERSSLNVIDEDRTTTTTTTTANDKVHVHTSDDHVGIEGPRMVPGIVAVDAYTQTLESCALRKRLGLDDDGIGGGVRISGLWLPSPRLPVATTAAGAGAGEHQHSNGETKITVGADENDKKEEEECKLQKDDVLMAIDGIEVGQDGTVSLSSSRPDERISKSHLFTQHGAGHVLELDILREGKPLTIRHTLVPLRYICPVHDQFDAHPSYLVCGGCVFVPLSWPWISAHKYSDGWEDGYPSFNSLSSLPAKRNKQIIVLSGVLADEVNVGYHLKKWLILKSVNGKKPANIRDVVRLIIEGGTEPNVEFRLSPVNQEGYNEQLICLDTKECKQSESRILQQHMIASWCSEDAIPPELKDKDSKTMVSLLESVHASDD